MDLSLFYRYVLDILINSNLNIYTAVYRSNSNQIPAEISGNSESAAFESVYKNKTSFFSNF